MNERTTARIVLLNENNRIFLLKSVVPNETFWLMPGGQIESGETPLEAAKRELCEETGIIDAQFITPHSYYSEAIYMITDTPLLFKEYFFIARTQNKQIYLGHHTEHEKKEIVEGKWWDLNEFIASGETFYPKGLLKELKKVVYQDTWRQGQ